MNFGHTVGHAIERALGYGTLLHGEAISLGIVAACEISVRKAGLSEEERERVVRALAAFDLPTKLPPRFPREEMLRALQSDKKFENGQVRFVVTPRLGSARLTSNITLDDIRGRNCYSSLKARPRLASRSLGRSDCSLSPRLKMAISAARPQIHAPTRAAS